MCGICGIARFGTSRAADSQIIERINEDQFHRGPDGSTVWRGQRTTLGHRRLAIIDLSEDGQQPFHSADGSVCVVFNGEIYNHRQLRQKYDLRTRAQGDGAILPDLWQKLGSGMFAELRGMYSIAICDSRQGTVTIARDPFGIKPLYWTRTTDDGVLFASEPNSMARLMPNPRISLAAIDHYLMYGAMGSSQAPYTGMFSVAPNSWIQWDQNLSRTDGLVQPELLTAQCPTEPSQLREAFLNSVNAHLESDVPVALLLSSGLDSNAIAWACCELGVSMTCVTVDPSGGSDEGDIAQQYAKQFGHRHSLVTTPPSAAAMQRYFRAMQRPSIDGLNTFFASSAVAGLGMKVALSGLGGDEVLAGYHSFRALRYLPLLRFADSIPPLSLLNRRPLVTNPKLTDLLSPRGPRNASDLSRLSRRILLDSEILALAPWHSARPRRPRSDRDSSAFAMSCAELTGYLAETLLPDADTFSMAWSVEMRVPFIDVPLAQTALAVDHQRGVGKRRFADTTGDPLLRSITQRPKKGFSVPMDSWMRTGPLRPFVEATYAPDASIRQLLDPTAIDRMMLAWQHRQIPWPKAWLLVALNSWLQTTAVPVDCDNQEFLLATH